MTIATDIADPPLLRRPEAAVRARLEHHRYADLLRSLDDADWRAPTCCEPWTVRDLAGHTVGMAETFSSYRQMVRYLGAAGRDSSDRPTIDKLTALQVRLNGHLSHADLIRKLETVGPRNARWRGARRLLRLRRDKQPMPDGTVEVWKTGYLLDVILTRDPWMHRTDIAAATGRPLVLTPDHDGRIVADVVAEWGQRHGQAFDLTLHGPAGGHFRRGTAGEVIELDAVEFCRVLSGRGEGTGLMTQFVPF